MNIYEKLSNIQYELKAPKNLLNKFGGYNYRNCEGICEAIKPFEVKYKVMLKIEDDVVLIGERFYIKATATLIDCEEGGSISATAFARESDEKKGMDPAQVTGASSSYARKYALNGLLLLDDTKDPDTDEFHEQTSKDDVISQMEADALKAVLTKAGVNMDKLLAQYKCDRVESLRASQKADILRKLNGAKK